MINAEPGNPIVKYYVITFGEGKPPPSVGTKKLQREATKNKTEKTAPSSDDTEITTPGSASLEVKIHKVR